MRRSAVAAVGLALLAVTWACSDQSGPQPRFPLEPSLAKGGPGGACSQQAASEIEKDIKDLYGSPAAAANALFDAVQASCSTTDPEAAREPLMVYLTYTIDNPVTGQESLMLAHWGRLFAFVGYQGIDVGSSPNISTAVFGASGATAVVDVGGVDDVVRTGNNAAAIKIPGQTGGLTGKVLVTIEPESDNCLNVNVQQVSGCQNFGIFPHLQPFEPPLEFAICADIALPANAALGHEPHGAPVEVLERFAPDFCVLHPTSSTIFGRDLGRFGRVLASVADLFRPRELIAGHTGLGGSGLSASPVGPLDTQTLFADFNDDVVGQPPDTTNYPGDPWTVSAPPPGSILVQASIGNLTDQPVVIDQGGGACANCGTLELSANMFNSTVLLADEGKYEVRFDALQNKPSVKEAALMVRDAQGDVIAKVAYRTVSSQPIIEFNGSPTGCTWTTGVAQHFVITIDFDTGSPNPQPKTWVAITGCSPTAPVDFYQQNADALVSVGWIMTKIDAGIVGWDNVQIVRLADNVP